MRMPFREVTQSALRHFDEYVLNGQTPGVFQVASTLIEEVSRPRGSSNPIVFYGGVGLKVAVALRRWQLMGAPMQAEEEARVLARRYVADAKYVDIPCFTNTLEFLFELFSGNVTYESLVFGDPKTDDLVYLFTYHGEGFSIIFLCFEQGAKTYTPFRLYCKGDPELVRAWFRDLFWKSAPDGATLESRRNARDGEETIIPTPQNLKPSFVVHDPSDSFHSQIEARLKHFYVQGSHRSVLLYGLPGTGKSTFARSICADMGARRLHVENHVFSSHSVLPMHLLEMINLILPDVLLLDDIDRSSDMRTLLVFFEHLKTPKLMIASVNRVSSLDPALLRPGRFDEVHEMPVPTTEYRECLIREYNPDLDDASVAKLRDLSEGFTPAELYELVTSLRVAGWGRCQAEISRLRKQRTFYALFENNEPQKNPMGRQKKPMGGQKAAPAKPPRKPQV